MIGETVIKKTIEAAGLENFSALANKLIAQALFFYVLYRAIEFPERLGKSLGAEIRSMLEGNIRKVNATFLKAMREELLKLTVMDVLSDYATSTISDVVKGDRADVCKKLIEKFRFETHPLDTLFQTLWDQLKSRKGLDKAFVVDLIREENKGLQGPTAGKVSKRLRKLLSKAATMSVTEIIASLISIRLCTGHNVK